MHSSTPLERNESDGPEDVAAIEQDAAAIEQIENSQVPDDEPPTVETMSQQESGSPQPPVAPPTPPPAGENAGPAIAVEIAVGSPDPTVNMEFPGEGPAYWWPAVVPPNPAPTGPPPGPVPAGDGETGSRRRVVVVAGTLGAAAALAAAAVGLMAFGELATRKPSGAPQQQIVSEPPASRAADESVGFGGPSPGARKPAPSATASPTAAPSHPPSPSADAEPTLPPAPPQPALLQAFYQTVRRTGAAGYTGQVIVSNVGDTTAVGWRVVITLPGNALAADASGVDFEQSGSSVTFVPRGDARVLGSGESVRFTFDIRKSKAGRPTRCFVNDVPCQ